MEHILEIEAYPMQVVIKPHESFLPYLRSFSKRFVSYTEYWDKRQRRKVRIPKTSYVFFTQDRREIRFLRTMLSIFTDHLLMNGLKENVHFKVIEKEVENVVDNTYPVIKEGWKPRGEQQALIDFIMQFDTGPSLLHLVGGGGKSYCSMEIISRFKERFVGIMRLGLVGKSEDEGWLKDFEKSYDIEKHEICRVSGSDQLKSLINICLNKKTNPYKAILISNKTLMSFIKNYENYSLEEFYNLGYNCTPQELPVLLQTNSFIVDEVHFDHHLNCHMASYFQLKRFICATATPDFDDKFTDEMVKLLLPIERRYVQKNVSVHVQPIAFRYRTQNPHKIKTDGFRGYSHTRFEKSIYRKQTLADDYHKMISDALETFHIPKLKEHSHLRALVTVATITTARTVRDYLRKLYPDKNINSYVDGEPVNNLYQSDICVSTVLGAGTGHDIPDLATVIMTNAVNATTPNRQCLWRLRKLDVDVEHTFVYFVNDDIDAHRKYDQNKRKHIFNKSIALFTRDYHYNKELRS